MFSYLLKMLISDPAEKGLTSMKRPEVIEPTGDGYVRIENRFATNRFLNLQPTGRGIELKPNARKIKANEHSAQFKLVVVNGNNVRIQSRWYPNKYVFLKPTGRGVELELASDVIQPNWASAVWKMVPSGQNDSWWFLQSTWYPDKYIYYDSKNDKLAFGRLPTNKDEAVWRIK